MIGVFRNFGFAFPEKEALFVFFCENIFLNNGSPWKSSRTTKERKAHGEEFPIDLASECSPFEISWQNRDSGSMSAEQSEGEWRFQFWMGTNSLCAYETHLIEKWCLNLRRNVSGLLNNRRKQLEGLNRNFWLHMTINKLPFVPWELKNIFNYGIRWIYVCF